MKLSAIVTGFAAFSAPLIAEMEPIKQLDELEWENRLLLAKASDTDELSLLNKQLDRYAAETLDRQLVVLVVRGDQLNTRNLLAPVAAPDALMKEVTRRLGDSDIALVGLDGGTKARFEWDEFELESVFAKIDRMPMRRAELRERQRNP